MTELRCTSRAGRQTSFFVPPREGRILPERIWIAFCGNGSLALDWLPLVTRDENSDDAFLLIDYPGYGKSAGWPSMAHNRAAADDALNALPAQLRVSAAELASRLAVMGHSLGAAAALDFAAHHEVQQIILLAPFTSLHEEVAVFAGGAIAKVFPDNYDNRVALKQIAQRRPLPRVTIFHGLQDEMIPSRMGRALAVQFPEFVTFRALPQADHSTVVAAAADEILALMNESPTRKSRPLRANPPNDRNPPPRLTNSGRRFLHCLAAPLQL